uniref:ATP-binding cassette sub-family C member 4-like n=1 Tax=Myxine glutinosa TaxID=7769 RepID=UPI00358E0961
MDSTRKLQRPNPLANANYLSQILFWWLNSLFSMGYKRQLEEDDMFTVLPQDSSEYLGERLVRCWKAELERASKKQERPSLSRAIIHCFWKMYIILGFFAFLEETLRVIQPLLLGGLIDYFQEVYTSQATAYLYAAGVSGCAFAFAIIHHIYFFQSQRIGMRIRVALCHIIYSKALRLSSTAMKYTTTGQVVNLLSNDVNRFDQVTIFMHYLWIGPLQAAAVVGLLWQEVGIACLAGISVLLILMPMQTLIGRVFSRYRYRSHRCDSFLAESGHCLVIFYLALADNGPAAVT